jgi:hypothetical protein
MYNISYDTRFYNAKTLAQPQKNPPEDLNHQLWPNPIKQGNSTLAWIKSLIEEQFV